MYLIGCRCLSHLAYNVLRLGEGGDFNHKCLCGERMLNIAVNVERSIAPPLLPNVCYALVAVHLAENFNRSKVFCSFLWVGENIFKLFLVHLVYMIYICTHETQLDKIHDLDKHRSWLLL